MYMWPVCICMHVYVMYVYVPLHTWKPKKDIGCPELLLSLIPEAGSLIEPRVRLTASKPQQSSYLWPSPALGLQNHVSHTQLCSWALNSGPCARTSKALNLPSHFSCLSLLSLKMNNTPLCVPHPLYLILWILGQPPSVGWYKYTVMNRGNRCLWGSSF